MKVYLCVMVLNLELFQLFGVDVEDGPKSVSEKNQEESMCSKKTDFSSLGDYSKCEEQNFNDGTYNFKITSWNVHSLRSCLTKGFKEYLKYENSDIYCIQQTRCSEKLLPPESMVEGYYRYYLGGKKSANSGVALYSKAPPLNVTYGTGNEEFDDEGRLIVAEYPTFFLACINVMPSGYENVNLLKRVRFDGEIREIVKDLDSKKPVVIAGDMNVAHLDVDVFDPRHDGRKAGISYMERNDFSQLLELGFADTFRRLHPFALNAFTSWSYTQNSRAKNRGWRTDYILVSVRLFPNCCDHVIRTDIYGSEHCPVTLFIELK